MKPFTYKKPVQVKDALESYGINSAFLAGGTNLVDLMKLGVQTPEQIIDLQALPLNAIEMVTGGIKIGALVKNSAVASHIGVQQHFPLLARAIEAGASQQLRNMASVGGNLLQRTRCPYFYDTATPCNKRVPNSGCSALEGYNRMHAIFGASEQCIAVHPSDMCVALAALEAKVIIKSKKNSRSVAFADFHRLPGDQPSKDSVLEAGELIESVFIPFNSLQAKHSTYLKIRDRASYAFALISVAALLKIEAGIIKDIRLAMGGVAHKPWRLKEAEAFLKGKAAQKSNFLEAANLAMKSAKAYEHNKFKLQLAPQTIVQALQEASTSKIG